jgi:hypothetical protein
MGQGGASTSHRMLGSQQNRENTRGYGGYGGSAMPGGRGGRISRGTRRGGTGDQMQPRNPFSRSADTSSPMSSYRPGTSPGMTTIQTPDFMRELNENFSNSPFQTYNPYDGGDTMQVQRSGGGRGGMIPTRQEALQGRLDASAIQNAAMQSGQMMPMYGGFGDMMGRPAPVADPYMVEQALGEGNFQDAVTAEEVGMANQEYAMGMGDPNMRMMSMYGGPTSAIANQSDFNFDGGVGLDDLGMALKAQAAGRAYEAPESPFANMDDMRTMIGAQQGVRDQYGAQEMRERRQRNMDRRMERLMSDMPAPRPREVRERPPVMGTGGTTSFPGLPNSVGRLQTRSQRGPGRGGRRFGHGGIIDAYGRRLI